MVLDRAQRDAQPVGDLPVALAVGGETRDGELPRWDSSAQAAWTDGGAYNACMIRVLSKIPGMPAAPGPGYNYSTMSY